MTDSSILNHLQHGVPTDYSHSIVSFAGARAAPHALNQLEANQCEDNDAAWESLYEPLEKHRCSRSWKETYPETILVPQDIPTLDAAVKYCNAAFQAANSDINLPSKHITILLQRGRTYELEQPLAIEPVGYMPCLTISLQ